jgi:hypothetical protein
MRRVQTNNPKINKGDIMQYQVVVASNPPDLSKEVNDYLRKGWKLQGGVAAFHAGGKEQLLQAMVHD